MIMNTGSMKSATGMRRLNIALIAMSGVRVRTPELADLGLTLPGFVERGKVIASLPSLGLLTVAGLTPADVDVAYRELRDRVERARKVFPDDVDRVYYRKDHAAGIPVYWLFRARDERARGGKEL